MDLHLDEKVFVVTGGMGGIGKAIVFALAREGAIPVILDRTPLSADYKTQIEKLTANYAAYEIDLNDTDDIVGIIDAAYQRYGRIDGIVNNAGANDNKSLEETSWREFEQSLHSNLTHYYETVHAAQKYLQDSAGAILNIGSKTALTGQGKTSAYAAAKGAILGLTREWAAALAPHGVRVNALVVAEAWTPLYEKWIKTFGDEEAQQKRLQLITDEIPLHNRVTTVEEIADTAVFLLSDRSSHTTGQWIHPDGGYVHLDRAL